MRADNPRAARDAVRRAIGRAPFIRFTLEEVVDRAMFDKASYEQFGKVVVQPPRSGYVDGRLFVLAYHGLERNLPAFEAIVATVSFPPSLCIA